MGRLTWLWQADMSTCAYYYCTGSIYLRSFAPRLNWVVEVKAVNVAVNVASNTTSILNSRLTNDKERASNSIRRRPPILLNSCPPNDKPVAQRMTGARKDLTKRTMWKPRCSSQQKKHLALSAKISRLIPNTRLFTVQHFRPSTLRTCFPGSRFHWRSCRQK